MTTPKLLARLERPQGRIDVVLDTDAYNEIDDQFAVAYMVRSMEKLDVKAIYAAPFTNDKSTGPADGMEKSYNEIHKILDLMGEAELKNHVYKGSGRYLSSETEPVISEAAEHLAALAATYTADKPLYVVAIGAITNVASAILLSPAIIENMVVVWLGGHALHWHDNREFNCSQDVAAARVVFGCGVPLVQLPCFGVVSSFTVSGPELEHWLKGKNALCDYLADYTCSEGLRESDVKSWTRIIWDVTAVAWLLDGDFMLERLEHSPIPQYDHYYSKDSRRHNIRYVYHIYRDRLFADLITKLTGEDVTII
jgi:inosine-uridine nucleoside N-ribohydrolase